MKQIEKVSIGGYVFMLEAEAAAVADSYLKDMSAYYSNPEITEGIEERMAELLRERTPEGTVVSKATIDSIIDILGRPERIAQDEPDDATPEKPAKKLYRDMENARVAGVCSGLAAYFKFDPAILRVGFVVLSLLGFIGFADHHGMISITMPAIYIIMWICMPPARTARQRWELRGDDGSAESVRRNIESGASDLGNALRQVGNAPVWGTLGRIIEVVIGLILLIVSVSGLFAGGLAVFGWQWLGLTDFVTEAINSVTAEFPNAMNVISTPWVGILGLAVYALPLIGMLYGSIMLLFRIKSPSWRPGLVIFVLWLMTVIAFGILTASIMLSGTAV
ncbi:MAG: PspC domain-containing protein [Bacteroidales bacterium]|nr:PspC domain-containing protein [Bacteroidales bacterium]